MTRITDVYMERIPPIRMLHYCVLIGYGAIRNQNVIYNRSTGMTIVEYDSSLPKATIEEVLNSGEPEAAERAVRAA